MEQVSSTGRPVQITVTEGYDLVKLFSGILEVPSLFVLLESSFVFSLLSPSVILLWLGEECVGRNGVLHISVPPDPLALHSNGTSFSVFLIVSL